VTDGIGAVMVDLVVGQLLLHCRVAGDKQFRKKQGNCAALSKMARQQRDFC